MTETFRGAWCAVEYSPFYGIEKGAVLQEARIFNDPHIDPRRCQQVHNIIAQEPVQPGKADLTIELLYSAAAQVITKLLYLLCQGETFTKVSSA